MTAQAALQPYQSIYVDLGFERRGLFALLQAEFGGREVLYPGCSVHLTPALYFPHVVFVDRDPAAQRFFANAEAVHAYVTRHRHYRAKAYLRFIALDYTQPLPVRAASFDLALALFAEGAAAACERYLKPGGRLVTNRPEAAAAPGCDLRGVIVFRRGRYQLLADEMEMHLAAARRGARPKSSVREARGRAAEYVERETYFVWQRRPAGGKETK